MILSRNPLSAALSIITGLLGVTCASGQNTGCYTVASLQGAYAVIGTYGPNMAMALGLRQYDGKGNFTAKFLLNEPTPGSTTGARTMASGTQQGTYTVNCDGSGVSTRILALADGFTTTGSDDFLIIDATVQNGQLLATKMRDAQRTPSAIIPGGVFLTRTFTRRPDGGCYTQASIQGSWGIDVLYGDTVAIALSPRTLDGAGKLAGTFVINGPVAGSPAGERNLTTGTQVGTYSVNCDGFGVFTRTLTQPNGTVTYAQDDFLVTEAVQQNGQLQATALVDMQRAASSIVPGTVFVSRKHTLRPTIPATAAPPPQSPAQTLAVASPKNATVLLRSIQLDGSRSASADGKPLTYLWTIPQGSPAAAILGANTANPTVQFTVSHTVYTFLLTVTDSTGKVSTDIATVDFEGK